ncbi:membrane protease YdiL (CAAX protease family) [Microbacterium trichothecenolyticum]|uniref:CPBP family intramembrane glutamic endopeptidase n=1 Tax=Microbacterium trichothecenolyticum TaxID=69370 RepID=UPI0028568EF2|nr:type II CAAX endopeptidase family protein [Microbacterium trichothecenolyticum]MDR7112937.1 membrane protease YdiL (CAAX protease family) [Microbacterium trichothecenolyticum]
MPDQPSDAAPTVDLWSLQPPAGSSAEVAAEPAPADDAAPRRSRRSSHEARTDWRLGGRTVYRWREGLLAIALISLGAGVLLGSLIAAVWDSPWAAASATAIVWIGMLLPVVWAFTRSRPIGLLRLRAVDVLYGVVLGALLRTTQGWIEGLDGTPAEWPGLVQVGGSIPLSSMIVDVVGPVVVAPVVEEFFFRAVVLVSLYTVLRRPFGKLTAGMVAALGSTALFVVMHGISGAADVSGVVSLSLLGLVCALLVLLTGRIWGAVLVHVVYNASYVALALLASAMT